MVNEYRSYVLVFRRNQTGIRGARGCGNDHGKCRNKLFKKPGSVGGLKRHSPYSRKESVREQNRLESSVTASRLLLLASCLTFSSSLKIETISFSEMWGSLRFTRCFNPEDKVSYLY
jgi:hypothetical protein